jgi:hypothetical protein
LALRAFCHSLRHPEGVAIAGMKDDCNFCHVDFLARWGIGRNRSL